MDISAALAATTATPANAAPSTPDSGIKGTEPFAQVMDRAREPSDSDEVREPTPKPADEASREAEKPGKDPKDAKDARDDATPMPTEAPFAMPAPAPINLELLEAFAEAANGLSAARDAQAPLETLLAPNAAMAAAQSAAPAQAAAQPAPVQEPVPVRTVTIQAPVQSPAFTAEASEALRTFVSEGVQVAEIRVTPESLGPVEVRIEIKDSRADIVMAAAAPETRIALERSLAELKQSLASAGIQLGQASVNDRQSGREQPSGGARKVVGSIEESAPQGRPVATGNRLVDLWA